MGKSRFTEDQILQVLQEHAAGVRTEEVCSKHGISRPTFYGWKAKYGGRTVSTARLLEQLQRENEHLRRLLSEALLTNAVMKASTSQIG